MTVGPGLSYTIAKFLGLNFTFMGMTRNRLSFRQHFLTAMLGATIVTFALVVAARADIFVGNPLIAMLQRSPLGSNSALANVCEPFVDAYPGSANFTHIQRTIPSLTVDPTLKLNNKDSYVVGYPSQVAAPNRRLMIFLSGAAAKPTISMELNHMATFAGYRMINMAYGNSPIPCNKTSPAGCNENWREETMTGTNLSSLLTVSRNDSIEGRLVNLLAYLDNKYPTEGWAQYSDGVNPIWEEIIVTGFSQGGAYAGLIGRDHKVGGIIYYDTLCDAALKGRNPFDAYCYNQVRATPGEDAMLIAHTGSGVITDKGDLAMDWDMSLTGTFVNIDDPLKLPPYDCSQLLQTSVLDPGAKAHGSLVLDKDMPFSPVDGLPVNKDAYMQLFHWADLLP